MYTWYIDIKWDFEIKILWKNIKDTTLKVGDKLSPEVLELIEDRTISEITLKKDKNWLLKNIERIHHIDSKNTTYTGLKNKYKHSDISSKIYKGRDKEYTVKEKIKLDNFDK